MAETIGFIGLGVMGKPMAKNLIKAGHRLVVHNRSRAAVDELAAAGATAATSPAEVARQATVVITMLPDTPDVEHVLDRAERRPRGAAAGRRRHRHEQHLAGRPPSASRRAVAEKGGSMLDAPVSGGEIGAINASLSIMVGGDDAAFARVKPILEAMGNAERIVHIGAGRRRAGLQGLQSDRDWRRARRRQRGLRAREKSRRRCRARAPGAARRIRREPRPRSPRRTDAHRQLQAGLPHEALSEGSATRERSRGGQRRRDAGHRWC